MPDETVRILATGVLIAPAGDPTPTTVAVQLTEFVEYDVGHGAERWNGTPQGPYDVPAAAPATSALLDLLRTVLPGNVIAELRIHDLRPSHWALATAPRRIDIDSALRARLILD